MNREEIYQNMMRSLDDVNQIIGEAIGTLKMNAETMSMIADEWVNGAVEHPGHRIGGVNMEKFKEEWNAAQVAEEVQLDEVEGSTLQPEPENETSEELAGRIASEIIKYEEENPATEDSVKMVNININPQKHNPGEVMELVQEIIMKHDKQEQYKPEVKQEVVDDAFDF